MRISSWEKRRTFVEDHIGSRDGNDQREEAEPYTASISRKGDARTKVAHLDGNVTDFFWPRIPWQQLEKN